MIKTIIFDNNGVLTTSCETGALDDLIKFLGVERGKFLSIWDKESEAVDEGKITSDQFLKNVLDRLGSKKDIRKCQHYYWNSYEPKNEVRDFAKKLEKDFELVFLTNFGDGFSRFNKKWKLEEIFDKDKIFVSANIGMVKPNEDIYLYVLNKIGKKPEEVVFIDDKQENTEAAKKLGMHAILFKSLDQLKKDLEGILKNQSALSSRATSC